MESVRIAGASDTQSSLYVSTQAEFLWLSVHIPNGNVYVKFDADKIDDIINALYHAKEKLR